ncbi:hypothetical protein TOTORO_00980 [Serratia phage vB_SmaS-Totoro]|nr:hypothetical protein TOTORO_00980 [Serratia phage vB_SmaS-Totoro]
MVMMSLPTAIVAASDMEESFGETVTHGGFSDNGMFLLSNDGKFRNIVGSSDDGRKLWDELTKARTMGKPILWGTGFFSEDLVLKGFGGELDKTYRKSYQMK